MLQIFWGQILILLLIERSQCNDFIGIAQGVSVSESDPNHIKAQYLKNLTFKNTHTHLC